MCGVIVPVLFAFTAVLGGVLRPGYSHLSDTVSELFSPGSPNKLLLDALHTSYALLLTLFGIGVLRMIRRSAHRTISGIVGASLYIASGVLSVATATVFPQDPWGSPSTFSGEMHKNLSGVLSLISLVAIGLIGHWFSRATAFSRYGKPILGSPSASRSSRRRSLPRPRAARSWVWPKG